MIYAKVGKLRANLGKYLKAVRQGKDVVIQDRDTPIARIVPYEAKARVEEELIWRHKDPAAPRLGDIKVRGIPYRGTDTTAMLREDRNRR